MHDRAQTGRGTMDGVDQMVEPVLGGEVGGHAACALLLQLLDFGRWGAVVRNQWPSLAEHPLGQMVTDAPPGTRNQHGVRPLSCRGHPIFT